MSYFIDICLICLKHSDSLELIRSQGTNGSNIENKLKHFLPEQEFNPIIPKYICSDCGINLNICYEFKQKCLRNIIIYEKFALQITTKDGINDYLSTNMRPNFMIKESELSDGSNYVTNIFESQNEIEFVDVAKSEKIIVKEENIEDLVLDDNLKLLLHEIKEENYDPDETGNKNEKFFGKNVQISNDSVSFSTNETINKQNEKKQYECHICRKKFITKVKLKSHIRLHNIEHLKGRKYDKKLSSCKICNISFRNLLILKQHNIIHTVGKLFIWKGCNKSFRILHNSKNHHSSHTGDKLFTCEVCDKLFRHLKCFKQHKLFHTNEKRFTCKACKKLSGLSSNSKKHKRVHNGEKPFPCEFCNKSFQLPSILKKHIRVHTGEKPFTCEVCSKSFGLSSNLKKHKLVHTGEKPFTCEVCNKSFRQLRHLKEHYSTHTGEKPYTCEICKRSFGRLSTLKKHKLRHIGEK